ncbi:MAG: FAD-dependent oxidoreductase [Deltaproteobacteria bacterium]|nr:FAD-dependent oxidoreductase [Deltaproteobacteria bacterium]
MMTLTCQVLVVGAGLAGFTAAVRAAENGADVLLIDKSDGEFGGGNVLMASGSLRAGGKSPRTTPTELYDFVMSEGIGYPLLVKAWSETCGRAVDWLMNAGVGLEETAPGRIWLNQESEISLAPVYKKDVGTRAVAALKARLQRLGGRFINDTEGLSLISERGSVQGVIARQSSQPLEVRGRTTILCTGGFSANKGMLRKYVGPRADQCKLRGSPQDTGDGLRMALVMGAKAVNLQYFYGHLISRKALTDDRFWPYPRLDSFVNEGMLIDGEGHRFVDEGRGDVAVANELARSPDPTGATLIFDHDSWEASKNSPSSTSLMIPAPNPWLLDNSGELFWSNTIEGLSAAIGVNADNLAATLAQYNHAVESKDWSSSTVLRSGNPKLLRSPFYGLRVVPGITFTMGGVLINGRGEALDSAENPIRGLYAAGDAIGGLMGGYRGGYTGGLMQAVVSGILAGENAADYIKMV